MINLKPTSRNILLEILVKANPTKVVEVPIQLEKRLADENKFNWKQVRSYLRHLTELIFYKHNSFIKFGIVGSAAAAVHFAMLYLLTDAFGLWYIVSAVLSILAASTFAYTLHYKWTFATREVGNRFIGWLKYQFVSGTGDLVYIGLLALLVEIAGLWYMLGALCAALLVYPVKFTIASIVVWKAKQISPGAPDYDWHSFYKGNLAQRWWKQRIAKTVWNWVPNASFLLDIGCGSSPIISKYAGATGIDTNEEKIDFMRHTLGNQGNGSNQARFAVMDAKSIKLPDESYDYVLCIEVLEHVKKSEKVISEISRLLKPRGRAVIATPDYSRWWWLLAEKFTPAGKEHVERYTRASLEEKCKSCGLVPVKHKYIAGCDLVELFVKTEETNGQFPKPKLQLAKTGIEILRRWPKPRISRANFAVTYLCNQRCKSCNIWQLYRNNSRVDEEVTVEEFNKILENNDLMWLSITGGEPFLKEGIGDMLEACLKKLKITSIVSNGSKPELTEATLRRALSNGENQITVSISLEGDQKTHDEFVGRVGSWELAMETLERLSRIKCSRLRLGIEQLVTTKLPGESIGFTKSIARALGIGVTYTFEQAASFYANAGSAIEKPEVPETSRSLSIFSLLTNAFVARTGGQGKACVAGEYSCFIDPFGVVYPCLFYTPTEPLVNLRETGYKIGKLDCKEIRRECAGCWTPCETYAAMIFRPWRIL